MRRKKRGTMSNEPPSQFNPPILGWSLFALFVLVSCNPPMVPQHQNQTAFVKPPLLGSEAGGDLSSKCFDCHQYRDNHHPIDVAPSNPEDYPFPLYDGKIKCLTCHHEDHAGGSANLLRGGPYADLRDICFQCHSEDKYAEIDPHIMLDETGMVLEVDGQPVCLFCHAVKPNPAKDRTEDVRFRADIAFLCWRCHSLMANSLFFEEHFLKKPPIPMIKFIERKEKELKVTIPLVPRERITCSTCHNPHQKGVISYGPSAKGADEPGRLRVPSPAICIVCHDL